MPQTYAGTLCRIMRCSPMIRPNLRTIHRRLLEEARDDRRERDGVPVSIDTEAPDTRAAIRNLWDKITSGPWGR